MGGGVRLLERDEGERDLDRLVRILISCRGGEDLDERRE